MAFQRFGTGHLGTHERHGHVELIFDGMLAWNYDTGWHRVHDKCMTRLSPYPHQLGRGAHRVDHG